MSKKMWVLNPRAVNHKISDREKITIKQKCDQFIGAELKPGNIKPFNPKNKKESQMIDIYCKWNRNNILFIARYKDLRSNVIAPEYEEKFARIGYSNKNKCYLYYMRHTGEWFDITFQTGESLKKCLKEIKELPHFSLI